MWCVGKWDAGWLSRSAYGIASGDAGFPSACVDGQAPLELHEVTVERVRAEHAQEHGDH